MTTQENGPDNRGAREMKDAFMRIDVLGIGFSDITPEEAVSQAYEIVSGGEKTYIVTPNPEIVWMARRDETLKTAVNSAGMVLPDGIGIIIGARILGTPLKGGRIPGIDFITRLFREMAETRGSVYLLGAKPGVAEEAGQRLAEQYPGLIIAGAADGYFDGDEQAVRLINASSPDLLLVCLGAPKQELWMAENIGRLKVRLCAGLGGSLDIFAGKVKRAPVFFRKLGLEWLYRLICEPRRIKRMIKLPLFVLAVARKRLFGKKM